MQLFKIAIFSFYMFSSMGVTAQAAPDTVNFTTGGVFTKVETEAEFPGGLEAWKKFLEKNLNAGVPVSNDAPAGKYAVTAIFIVDTDGSVSNIKPETKLGYGMEEEVVRVLQKSGKWTPAIFKGKPVKAYRRQPITFILDHPDLEISTEQLYTLFANTDNLVKVVAKKVKPEDIAMEIPGARVVAAGDGSFTVRINKTGRVLAEFINSKKEKTIGTVSFEVKNKQ
ncbi:MAG: energy transducer TonB [Ferruginibacter sp.]